MGKSFIYRISLSVGLLACAEAWAACPAPIPDGYVEGSGPTNGYCVSSLANDPEFGIQSNQYPVCGPNRVPVTGDGSYLLSSFAASGTPSSSNSFSITTGPNYTFNAVTSTTSGPTYGFPLGSKCACIATHVVNPRNVVPSAATSAFSMLPPTVGSGDPRVAPDTADVIMSQNNAGTVRYGPVAISKIFPGNGRLYAALYGTPVNSFCGCPNINELATRIDSSVIQSGAYCLPGVNAHVNRVLTPYNPDFHVTAQNQILDTFSAEPTASPVGASTPAGGFVTQFQLPASSADFTNMVSYVRKIWTCAAPFELNVANRNCEYTDDHHACDDGSGGGPISAYATTDLTVAPTAAAFNALANKKLACCLNRETNANVASPYAKFDCIQNAVPADFNTLWALSDTTVQGGKLNALLLFNGSGRPVTGFYSMKGQRCNQFSEFAFDADIQPYQVNPIQIAGQQARVAGAPVAVGTPMPIPTSGEFAALNALATALGKSFPQNAKDYNECPILVRAAMVATCPTATVVPNAINMYDDGGTRRCPVAQAIQIHLRIEQVYHILGQPLQTPLDTVINGNLSQSIDISSIISAKYGDACPPGTVNHNGVCSY